MCEWNVGQSCCCSLLLNPPVRLCGQSELACVHSNTGTWFLGGPNLPLILHICFFWAACINFSLSSPCKKSLSPPRRRINHRRQSRRGSCVSSTGSSGSALHASRTLFKRGSFLMRSSLSPLLIYRGLISLKPARPRSRPLSLTVGSLVSKTVAWRPCSAVLFTWCETADEEEMKEEWMRQRGSVGVGVIHTWIKLSKVGERREIVSFPQYFLTYQICTIIDVHLLLLQAAELWLHHVTVQLLSTRSWQGQPYHVQIVYYYAVWMLSCFYRNAVWETRNTNVFTVSDTQTEHTVM